jgi:eukaryotic-like serine/threonine-protein kinase
MLSPGDKIKDYEVVAPIGSGGMAMLYLARRRGVGGFSRLVTLKLVHPHLTEDEHVVKLFLNEARIAAHVTHPNVVHVEEVGQAAGSYFIAMEYVHGVTLAELLARLSERSLRLRPTLCVWLAAQIAEALHAAHEARTASGVPLDIVHRDVSPQNVLIGHTGHVKLIDFGIAKSQAENDQRSGGRAVLGKLRYMSPEQLELQHADRRTDVYALGVMLWEMLAGRRLLRCQRFDDERDWATRENPPAPSQFSKYSLQRLDRVVLKALACDASERYENAFQFRTALLRAVPASVQLDAPMVAAVMRSMFGEELDHRRASWPSEVVGALDVAASVQASQHWSLDELTADNASSAALNADDERVEDEPADVPQQNADGADGAEGAAGGQSAEPSEPSVEPSAIADAVIEARASAERDFEPEDAEPEAAALPIASAIDTLKVPPVVAGGVAQRLGERTFRVAAIGAVCLASGIVLGSRLSSQAPAEIAPTPEPERSGASVVAAPAAADPAAPLAPGAPQQPAAPAAQDIALTARVDPRTYTLTDLRADEISRECEARALRAYQAGHGERKWGTHKRASARRAERSAKAIAYAEKRKRYAAYKAKLRLARAK